MTVPTDSLIVLSRCSESSKHCMGCRVKNKIGAEERPPRLSLNYRGSNTVTQTIRSTCHGLVPFSPQQTPD